MKEIKINNAYLHNLKNINVTIPKGKLVVVTGISGSGKSSLVFDIVFEEGRKQYLQALGMSLNLDDNKFDSITGISPAIAVKQSVVRQSNPRSTVGSKTNILNMLGILFSNQGKRINDELLINEEEKLDPSYFSYNAPEGMCMKCSGRGTYFELNMDKIVPNDKITVQQVFENIGATSGYINLLQRNYKDYFSTPFNLLPYEIREDLIYGIPASNSDKRSYCIERIFQNRYQRGENVKDFYMMKTCPACQGFRVGDEARSIYLNNHHIGEVGKMTLNEAKNYLQELLSKTNLSDFGHNLGNKILNKLEKLIEIRLGHLTLYREMPSLSGGELQRLFLNSHLESKMDSLIYIFDEPTSGLHEFEKEELLNSILKLKESGNTIIVVEHDKSTIEIAEHIIDVGPKAGINGGNIVYEGNLEGFLNSKDSITGQYLSGKIKMPERIIRNSSTENNTCLTIKNAKTNNLKNLTVSFPLNKLVGVAGVSGSGKSSLISNTLLPLLKNNFNNRKEGAKSDECIDDNTIFVETVADQLDGIKHISGYVEISQAPIGRKINSIPISYLGIWDKIRSLFSQQSKAVEKNLSAGDFSFNSKGACPTCGGSGSETILIGNYISFNKTCSECKGKRFNHESLSIKFHGKDIYEVLEMSVSEAVLFFKDTNIPITTLEILEQIGMGYIKLGQPTPTLSGGEAQRIKLAKEIGKQRKGNTLYVLDEPTTGLGQYDTSQLIKLLDKLIIKGNSVVVIEHDLDVLSSCDWIIELGPTGGMDGGYIIAENTPQKLKEDKNSITGRYL